MANKPRGVVHRHGWIWLLAYALAVIAIGVLALVNPILTGLSIGIMLGLALITYGGLTILAAFARRKADWLEALLGLIALIAGAMTLTTPLSGTATLVWMTGAWLLIAGIFSLISSFEARANRTWLLVTGVLNILLGGFLLWIDPVSALAYAAIMLGISLISRGTFLAITAIDLPRAQS